MTFDRTGINLLHDRQSMPDMPRKFSGDLPVKIVILSFCGREAVPVFFAQLFGLFIPTALILITRNFIDRQIIRSRFAAGESPAARAAGKAVFTTAAPFIVPDAIPHCPHTGIPIKRAHSPFKTSGIPDLPRAKLLSLVLSEGTLSLFRPSDNMKAINGCPESKGLMKGLPWN